MPITKTTGNSSPLALCSVIRVTSARSTSSESWSEKSEISWRNASSEASSWPRVLVLARDPDQLLEVLDPALRLEGALGLEHVHVAARRERLLEQGRGPRLGRLGPQVVHQRRELAHLPRGGRRERHRRRVLDGLHERPAHVGRVLRQPLEGRLADPPPRAVHDPPERHLVGRVGDHLEIRDRILHLGPLVEARAADHAVRHALADEQILEHARLRIDPVEDGDVGRARTAVDRLGDLAGDEPRLGMLVVGLDDPHRHAAAELRPEPLRLAVRVAVDDRVGGVENRLRRAVVLLERDDVGAREVVLELGDVSDVGAPEGVDRLILVADDRDVPVALREERHEPELGVVRVLVLVDHDVAPPVLPGGARLLVVLEQEHGPHDQVVEVHRVGVVEPLLVERVDVGRRLLEERRDLLGVGLRRQQPLLGARDPRVHGARREPLGVELELLGARLDEPELVGLVIDREARRVAGARGVAAQEPTAGGVERHHPHPRRGAAADQPLDSLAHLARRPVRERDREDLGRPRALRGDQVRNAVGEDAGLARPGARHDQQRALGVQHRVALFGVERVEEGVVWRDRVRHYRTALTGGRVAIGSAEVPTTWILPTGVGGPAGAGPPRPPLDQRTRTDTVALVPPASRAVAAATARRT